MQQKHFGFVCRVLARVSFDIDCVKNFSKVLIWQHYSVTVTMEFTKKRAGRFPCGHYGSNCVTDILKCGMCRLWFHRNCQSVSASEFEKWTDIELDFICVKCRSDGDKIDYPMAMELLRKVNTSIKNNCTI